MTEQSANQTPTMTPYASVPYLPLDARDIEKALTVGDVAKMPADVRVQFYRALCTSCGLNPLLKTRGTEHNPGGELVWYATVGAAEQLRKLHHVSTTILSRERTEDGLYIVTVKASTPDGREEESQGIVAIAGLKGQELGNAMMRAGSKALRRVTLAICGLGMGLAEEEAGQVVPFDAQTGEIPAPVESPTEPLLPVIGRWFRTHPSERRAAIAQAVWGTEMRQIPHLSHEDLEAGWTLIDGGHALLPWESPTLAEEVQAWRKSRANEAITALFGEETDR